MQDKCSKCGAVKDTCEHKVVEYKFAEVEASLAKNYVDVVFRKSCHVCSKDLGTEVQHFKFNKVK